MRVKKDREIWICRTDDGEDLLLNIENLDQSEHVIRLTKPEAKRLLEQLNDATR